MSMTEWAENEVKLACKKENPDWDGKSFDYGCSCYQSALKAYKSIMEDDHSGYSFAITKNILVKLLNMIPLTPIEDTEEDWNQLTWFDNNDNCEVYQCCRRSSLFKRVYKDGAVKYNDNERYYCIEIDNPKDTYSGGGVGNILNELFPITMPYNPSVNKYKVYTDTFLALGYEGDNTDFNTRAILYCITPDGEKVEINKFYGEKDNELQEITKEEYEQRKAKMKVVEE